MDQHQSDLKSRPLPGDMPEHGTTQEATTQEATTQEATTQEVTTHEAEDNTGKSFADLILGFAVKVVGEPDTGDLTPVLLEDAMRAHGIVLRDQANGREMVPALDDMGAFLRQCVAAGVMVHLPKPGDIVIMQYNVSRLYWSAIVESVASTDLGVLISLPPVDDRETEYQRMVMKRGGLNDAWRVVGFIRL